MAEYDPPEPDAVVENVKAEEQALRELLHSTGIHLARLSLANSLQGDARSRFLKFAAERLDVERNAAVRFMLYQPFVSQAAPQYLERLMQWHCTEDDLDSIRVLEAGMLESADSSAIKSVIAQLLASPRKLRRRAMQFVIRRNVDESAIALLRDAFVRRELDLEELSILANQHAKDYDRLVQGISGPSRLTAKQCTSLVYNQIPAQEYGFSRPDLVPYFSVVVTSIDAVDPLAVEDMRKFCADCSMTPLSEQALQGALKRAKASESTIVALQSGTDGAQAVAVLVANVTTRPTRYSHRRKNAPAAEGTERIRIALVASPPMDDWNLFPKYLLPADHPLRHARPEADE